jgi:hypothetical protein
MRTVEERFLIRLLMKTYCVRPFALSLVALAVFTAAPSVHAVALVNGISATATMPIGFDVDTYTFAPGSQQFTQNNPTFGEFDFSANYAQLPGVGVVGISLALYGFDTGIGWPDHNNISLVLSGVNTNTLLVETVQTGVLLNGFSNEYTQGNFSFTTTAGAAILELLNNTGGIITAGIQDSVPSPSNVFWFAGGTMTLTLEVPFNPAQTWGLSLLGVMVALRAGRRHWNFFRKQAA